MGGNTPIVKAMVLIRRPRDGALLVSEHTDPSLAPFQRPLGGHVEFGEYALDTVHRELREEIGQDLAGARLLCVLENIFQWHDAAQHEIVFVFAAAFADESAYDISGQEILDEPDGRTRVIWRPPDETSPPLYPVGVADLVARCG